ncbi:cytochrome c family protein [Mesorhizobium sp. SB112]|uniref:c-type cytochrome n=1 Tax=Mesorhizobium sp. SB112 TaxID=3151853 RepID=UPI0032649116
MDSFEFNKIIGGLLGTVFVVFSIAIVSDGIFAAPVPEKPGFHIEAVEPEAGGAAEAAVVVPIANLLEKADAAAGEAVFRRCTACHSGEKGGPNKVGPDLWDIVNRPVASHEGFAYSGALKEFAQGGSVVWDYQHLSDFIHAPKGLVRGTAMGFAGIKKDDERANLIAYLRTLSDNPAPLPTPEAEPAAAPAEGAAPADGAAPAEGEAPAQENNAEQPAAPAPTEGEAPANGEAEQPAKEAPAEGENAPAEQPATPAPAQ